MDIALLGHMGRDEALADRLEGHRLHILGQWQNPGLYDKALQSGGTFGIVDSITDTETVADFVQQVRPGMFLTNFDDALAAGVVDTIQNRVKDGRIPELLIPCPERSAARIEHDKFYLRELVESIDPSYNPVNFMADNVRVAEAAIEHFESLDMEVAIKPRNLTGGKGVKVMGKHFDTYQEARDCTHQVLNSQDQSGVEIQEKLSGHEFTLQILTDGKTTIAPPATYDYPYREDGDIGPGTGGMGAFSMQPGEQLPFIESRDYTEVMELMQKILIELNNRGHDYKGVLYPTFFKTDQGLKIVEVNARGGDPELINILDLMEDGVDVAQTLSNIATGELSRDDVRYKKLSSAMIYLVAPSYGYGKGSPCEFTLDPQAIEASDCKIRFAAAQSTGNNHYTTVGTSRTVGISALAPTPWEARDKILSSIDNGFGRPLPLQYRSQIAEEAYIKSLAPTNS